MGLGVWSLPVVDKGLRFTVQGLGCGIGSLTASDFRGLRRCKMSSSKSMGV